MTEERRGTKNKRLVYSALCARLEPHLASRSREGGKKEATVTLQVTSPFLIRRQGSNLPSYLTTGRAGNMKARLTYLKQFSDLQGNTSNQGLGLDLFLCVRTSVKP